VSPKRPIIYNGLYSATSHKTQIIVTAGIISHMNFVVVCRRNNQNVKKNAVCLINEFTARSVVFKALCYKPYDHPMR
jgi:DNA-directed RNA polymerase subunit E'/Rpb7